MRKKTALTTTSHFHFKVKWGVVHFILLSLLLTWQISLSAAPISYGEIEKEVKRLMEEGDIPGLSLAIIRDKEVYINGFGMSDLEKQEPVTPATRFELASCSKAFTALAALKLERDGLLNLDKPVSHYFPWFYATYQWKKYPITIRQLLHQTSGIPFNSISRIPRGRQKDAARQTVKNLVGIHLNQIPGSQFEYATVNYALVGAVIEQASGMSYEEYMAKEVFAPLGLTATIAGIDKDHPLAGVATGYKIGFLAARKYDAPVYWGNNPAGYIISNGKDIARWLQFQMGLLDTDLQPLILKTQQPDETVPLNRATLSSYAMGWFAYLQRMKRIDHGGNNPNFTAFMVFNPEDKIGVAVMANSNSNFTQFIGNSVMSFISGKEFLTPHLASDDTDKGSVVISLMVSFLLLAIIAFLILVILDIFKDRREYKPLTPGQVVKFLLALVLYAPFILGIYFVPRTIAGVSMETAVVFAPLSFKVAILLTLSALGMSYLAYVLSSLFPHKNKYFRTLPLALVLSLLSGGANAVVIFLISHSVFGHAPLGYQVYNFALAFFLYIVGRKILQTKLTRVTFDLVYDFRIKLIEKIFYTSYQKFEKIDDGRVLATLNDDTGQIGNAANILVQLVTSSVTTLGAFLYLASIAFWATLLTLLVVAAIGILYAIVTNRTRVYFEEARNTQNVYLGLLNGLVAGFKELSLQYNKKKEYQKDIADSCDKFRNKASTALIKFINAFMIGESLLIIVLGCVGFGIPRLFPQIGQVTVMAFIMVLLYLIGPINAFLNAIPAIQRLKVSWDRVQEFIRDIPANMDPMEIEALDHGNPGSIQHIKAQGLTFEYETTLEYGKFKLGPMDFEAHKGEVVFLIGGNGSGKTTVAKLITGLYLPGDGKISIDGKEINTYQLSEYYSTVFSDYHLFDKLYNVQLAGREEQVRELLKMMKLEDKVIIEGNSFSTIDLSGGQRKRLALLLCYLEDRPIFLFDEVVADQDPVFRKFFYRELLKKMKKDGKIVIAITHDDHYFDAADKIIKMDMGKIDVIREGSQYMLTSN